MKNTPYVCSFQNPHVNSPKFWLKWLGWLLAAALFAYWVFDGQDTPRQLGVIYIYVAVSIIACLYFAYLAMPYSITFYPVEQRYEYLVGIKPLAYRKSGYFCELDSVIVNQTTMYMRARRNEPNDTWWTTYQICAVWATENRRVALDVADDIMEAEYRAKDLAEQTGVPYGGIYDGWNKMWIVGPMHKKIGNETRAADDAEKIADHLSAQHAPPALGDDKGFNESGMWK